MRSPRLGTRVYAGLVNQRSQGSTRDDASGERFTARLRLVPIGPANARDLWRIHSEDEVAVWYGDTKPSFEDIEREARMIAWSWRVLGAHKWVAYERASGELVGRGGVSYTPADDDWGQVHSFLPSEPWVREARVSDAGAFHASWVEIGWALRLEFWGRGYASEIGCAGLAFAFRELDAHAVVSCTERHNSRSRAVMDRIGMRYAGEIRSRGHVEAIEGERDDAPFAVSVLLRSEFVAANG